MNYKIIKCFKSKYQIFKRTKDRILRGKVLKIIENRLLYHS